MILIFTIKNFKEKLEIIEHYKIYFGNDEGLVSEEYRRVGINVKDIELDRRSTIYKLVESKVVGIVNSMVLIKHIDVKRYGSLRPA